MEDMNKNDNAPFFGLENNGNPRPRSPIFYGSTTLPHPTNAAAKIVPREQVVRSFMGGKR